MGLKQSLLLLKSLGHLKNLKYEAFRITPVGKNPAVLK